MNTYVLALPILKAIKMTAMQKKHHDNGQQSALMSSKSHFFSAAIARRHFHECFGMGYARSHVCLSVCCLNDWVRFQRVNFSKSLLICQLPPPPHPHSPNSPAYPYPPTLHHIPIFQWPMLHSVSSLPTQLSIPSHKSYELYPKEKRRGKSERSSLHFPLKIVKHSLGLCLLLDLR
jgi:hypothetical protein